MIYLHEKLLGRDDLIRRWCNEISDEQHPEYETPTFWIHNITTDVLYEDAVDIINERRIEMGLEPYFYEMTNTPIDPYDPE